MASSWTIGELVKARRWLDAANRLVEDPEESLWTDPSNGRTPLHILCRLDFRNSSDGDEGGSAVGGHVDLARMLIDASHASDPVILPNPVRLDADGDGGDVCYAMHNSALTVRDYLGDTPLHCLCGHMRSASLGLVRAILESARDADELFGDGEVGGGDDDDDDHYGRGDRSAPTLYELVSAQNCHGCTPLHFIAEGSACPEIFRLLLDACRAAVRSLPKTLGGGGGGGGGESGGGRAPVHPTLIMDDDGDTPLHFACSGGLDAPFLRDLLRDEPGAVLVTNRERKLPVDDLIVCFVDDNELLPERFEEEEEEDEDPSGVHTEDPTGAGPGPGPGGGGGGGATPETAPLLERLPPAALAPLWDQVDVLLRAAHGHPLDDEDGDDDDDGVPSPFGVWRPLHAAAALPSLPSSVLRLALRLFTDELGSRDEAGKMPLHLAASHRPAGGLRAREVQPPEAETYEELARWDDSGGEGLSSMVRFLARAHPAAVTVLSVEGRLPLHHAVSSGRPWSDIECLLSLSPRTLEARDAVTGLYPFMLAAVEDNNSVGAVHELLLGNPELVRGGIP